MGKKKTSRFRKANKKGAMLQRTEEAYNNRGSSGKFKNILSDDLQVEQFKPANGDHIFDIIPYIAGKNNPNTVEGDPAYKLDVWVHQKIGPRENAYICPAINFDKPCPICEYIAKLKKEEDNFDDVDHTDLIADIKLKRRVVYNVVVYNTAQEEEKGVQIFEASHYLVEQPINAVSKIKRTGGFIAFSDPDKGKTIECEKTGAQKGTKYIGFSLTERPEIISDAILDQAQILDEIVDIYSYDQLAEFAQFDNISSNDSKEEYEANATVEEEEYEEYEEDEEDDIPLGKEATNSEYEEDDEEDIPFEDEEEEEDDIPFEDKEDDTAEVIEEPVPPRKLSTNRIKRTASSSKSSTRKRAAKTAHKTAPETAPTRRRRR